MNVRMKKIVNTLGIPRLIIIGLLIVILIAMPILGLQIEMLYTQAFGRIGMYMVLVLAMVPAIESGIKMNMALPVFCHAHFRSDCGSGRNPLRYDLK